MCWLFCKVCNSTFLKFRLRWTRPRNCAMQVTMPSATILYFYKVHFWNYISWHEIIIYDFVIRKAANFHTFFFKVSFIKARFFRLNQNHHWKLGQKTKLFCFDIDNGLKNVFLGIKLFLFFKIESWNSFSSFRLLLFPFFLLVVWLS